MDDLISREETLKAMDTWDKFGYDAYGRLFPLRSQDELHLYVPYVHYADMVNVVKGMPSAQKTGKWIHDGKDFPHGNDWIHCSVCGKPGINVPADLTNYCPNCGAKMEEEQ